MSEHTEFLGTKTMITPVILCGGSGSRLWPLSRKTYPKPLLSFAHELSMLQETVLRLAGLPHVSPPIIICNEEHRFVVAEQLASISIHQAKIILEPTPKNTAPAATIAALLCDPETLLFILPADHQIKKPNVLIECLQEAEFAANSGYLITFGMQPTSPETGYGYIKKENQLQGCLAYQVNEFIEKPSLEKATHYFTSQDYCWNSGMFMFRAKDYLAELGKNHQDILESCHQALEHAKRDIDFIRLDKTYFDACPSDSIDYAVMEKSKQVAVILLHDSGWSDLGSWDAIYDTKLKDNQDNVIEGDVYIEDVKRSYLHAESRLLAAVGVSDHIIIETADAVLVAHKNHAQDVKKIVQQLELKKRPEVEYHQKVHRPWGYYEVIDKSKFFQVKRIVVKPNEALSLQMHHFRSEHWIVIEGKAEVICGEKTFILDENQSTYIPSSYKHRLKNNGMEPLTIIEVQTGSYLGEDDIVRYDDHYGRAVTTSKT